MSAHPTSVPMPPRHWLLRLVLPLSLLAAAAALLVGTGWRAIAPAPRVRAVPVALLPLSEGGAAAPEASAAPGAPATPAAPPAPPAPTAPARLVQAPGWIEPDPFHVVVSALRDGVVEEVLVLDGDQVHAGQTVARLESRTAAIGLARADAELARAGAERERRIAMAEEARAELAQLPLRQAAARAKLAAAEDASARADRLAQSNAIGEAEVVRLRSQAEEARAELQALEPRRAALEAAERAARAEAATILALPAAQRDDAALILERSEVKSPCDGVVLEVLTTPGHMLMAGDNSVNRGVVSVYDPRHLRVRTDVPLADAAGLQVGQRAEVEVEVLPGRTLAGVVSRLVHKADIQKNTVGVKVTLQDPSSELKPDMIARVRIHVARPAGPAAPATPAAPGAGPAAGPRAAMAVPESAVRAADDAASADLLVAAGLLQGRATLEARRVTLGARRADGWREIRSGASPGDLVVLDPDPSLLPGTLVEVEVHHAAR